uniref:Ion_trans domain-containing protein n=1 Tax=Panagrellus redivivus TaxID=6233 RepID=A0A7E4ZYK8_PANRE
MTAIWVLVRTLFNQRIKEGASLMCYFDEVDQEEEFTLKGFELWLFITLYIVAVIGLIVLFEIFMPVFNNPGYPFYNHVPDYTFKATVQA